MLQNRRTYMSRVICNVTDGKDSFVIHKKCFSNTLFIYAKYWIMQMIEPPLAILAKGLYICMALIYLTIFQWLFYKNNDKSSKLRIQSIEILLSCDVFQKMSTFSSLFKSWLYANVDLEQLPDKCIVNILKHGKNDNNKCEPNNLEPCPISYHFMPLQKRKILVLDLDETLIHSYHENNILWRNNQTLTKNYSYNNAHNPQAFMYCINNFYNNSYNLTKFSQLDSYLNQFFIQLITWLKPKPIGLAGQHNLKSILSTNLSLSPDGLGNHLVNRKTITASNGCVNGYAPAIVYADDTENKAISYGGKQYLYSLIYRLYLVISIILFTLPKIFINLFVTYIYTTPMMVPNKFVSASLNIGNNSNNNGTNLPPPLSPVSNLTGLSNNLPAKEPDFTLKLCIDRHPVRFFVYKRPHVETFLSIVSQWYDLVVYTASMQIYGSGVADHLDQPLPASTTNFRDDKAGLEQLNFSFEHGPHTSRPATNDYNDALNHNDSVLSNYGSTTNDASQSLKLLNNNYHNGEYSLIKSNKSSGHKNAAPNYGSGGNTKTILSRRYYRQHCKAEPGGGFSKDLAMVDSDLSRVFILDNSPTAYRAHYPHNGIHIKSWFNDPNDRCLLDLLPFLDSLRYVSDVRSVLSRNIHALNQPSQPSSHLSSTGAVANYNPNYNANNTPGARISMSLLDKLGAMGSKNNQTFISNQSNNTVISRSLNMDRTGGLGSPNALFNKEIMSNDANLNLQPTNTKSYNPQPRFIDINTENSNKNDYLINVGSNLRYAQRPSGNYTPTKGAPTNSCNLTPVSSLNQSSLLAGDPFLHHNSLKIGKLRASQQNSSTKKSVGGNSIQQPINAGDNNVVIKSSCQTGNRYFKPNPTVAKSLNYALTSVHSPVSSTVITQKLNPTFSRTVKTSSATTKIH